MSLYKSDLDRLCDAIVANSSSKMKWRRGSDGRIKLEETKPLERLLLQEDAAEAEGRLVVDAAMRK